MKNMLKVGFLSGFLLMASVAFPSTVSNNSADFQQPSVLTDFQARAEANDAKGRQDNSCSAQSCSVSCAWNQSASCANPCAYEGGDCSSCTCN